MYALFLRKPTLRDYFLLYLAAFIIRALTFSMYVQHEERYCQPDSPDYHNAALCLSYGHGMHYPNGRPIFWRTPGYPWFLNHFYKTATYTNGDFSAHTPAHKTAIWVQIMLCSLLPLLLFSLGYTLTRSTVIAWIAALISIFHIGFVLASTYLLTDGLALILFTLFLIFFFKSFSFSRENLPVSKHSCIYIVCAIISLSLFTWMRPMGQFIGIIATVILLFSSGSLSKRIAKSVFFLVLFSSTLFPWFYRNQQLTGHWFFCPLFGLYFNAFNAPKILARVARIPLIDAHKKLTYDAAVLTHKKQEQYKQAGIKKAVCGEIVCLKTSLPLIYAFPGYFMYDWIVESCKTAFDLHTSQLVAFHDNCFKWDPLVEYLDEKIKNCLYAHPLPVYIRLIAWLEFIFSLMVWIGIIGGILYFMLQSLCKSVNQTIINYSFLWIKTGLFIGVVILQTGGFGYARLRLPIEPLMLILGITFWWWYLQERTKKQ